MQSFSSVLNTQRSSSTRAHLSRLPVPDLRQTLQRYLKSLEPLLREDEPHDGTSYESAYALRAQWAEDFEKGLGAICQMRLQVLDRASPNNWLEDNIWLKKAYHEWREPLLVNSNWWLSFVYDSNVPQDVLEGKSIALGNTGITPWQVRRAAWLTHRLLDFKGQVQRQQMYSDTTKTGKSVWFHNSANKIFNTSRLPCRGCDIFSPLAPDGSPFARSVLVSVHDWIYAVEVIDPTHTLVPPCEIEKRLRSVIRDVHHRISNEEIAVPVSVLGTDNRDRWAENLEHLLSLSPSNYATLEAINHSIIGLSLDHYTYTLGASSHTGASILVDSPQEVDAHLHNLRSSHPRHPGRNRWYDKPFTFIVESNSRAGAIGEHSPVDALVPSILADYAVVQGIEEDSFGPLNASIEAADPTTCVGWQRLDWTVDDHIRQECIAAEERARVIVEDSDDSVLWFDHYGADWIKTEARLSPDAYIQMALQLAWYRTRGCFTATYETALTRIFHNARTETIRTLSSKSREWVLAMDSPDTSIRARFELLQAAVAAHTRLTRLAATGKGIDRHLLGLRCMLEPGETHELFEDELFTRSQTWKLSTSGLSAGNQFRGTGFGAQVHDGYGINYLAGPNIIKFGIESKHSSPLTSTPDFKQAVVLALQDMYRMCLEAASPHL
ncbi:acyltransferase ChoActase/COT/CPT [Irpex rosettiformis]|uniref:Acyltransferase ChoActase/COT/CPT n=1 Tax=Irpex rosettiformis TaxID=378272 RepID=A0ACB8UAE6_9APHY|nr:acyltransferase ChoActase/COT/CPT [Irpex rosettiformis]